MMLSKAEDAPLVSISWQETGRQSQSLGTRVVQSGREKSDRVIAYMPNIPETIVAVLAAASIGAIWSSCSPDFGSRSVLDPLHPN